MAKYLEQFVVFFLMTRYMYSLFYWKNEEYCDALPNNNPRKTLYICKRWLCKEVVANMGEYEYYDACCHVGIILPLNLTDAGLQFVERLV